MKSGSNRTAMCVLRVHSIVRFAALPFHSNPRHFINSVSLLFVSLSFRYTSLIHFTHKPHRTARELISLRLIRSLAPDPSGPAAPIHCDAILDLTLKDFKEIKDLPTKPKMFPECSLMYFSKSLKSLISAPSNHNKQNTPPCQFELLKPLQ